MDYYLRVDPTKVCKNKRIFGGHFHGIGACCKKINLHAHAMFALLAGVGVWDFRHEEI